MCGRYAMYTHPSQVHPFFSIVKPVPNWAARYNVAPTQDAPVVVDHGDGRAIEMKRWWLVPSWSKEPGSKYPMFNARAETVREKPSFKTPFEKRRCIVPADGFYEWTGPKNDRVPHFIQRADGQLLGLAGLYDVWKSRDGTETVNSFTIIVTAANDWMSRIHDRMPVILEPSDFDTWLKGTPDAAATLLRPAANDLLKERIVSKSVNAAKNEGAELIA
jgi:putative SOS response-associated peptidase YedK